MLDYLTLQQVNESLEAARKTDVVVSILYRDSFEPEAIKYTFPRKSPEEIVEQLAMVRACNEKIKADNLLSEQRKQEVLSCLWRKLTP